VLTPAAMLRAAGIGVAVAAGAAGVASGKAPPGAFGTAAAIRGWTSWDLSAVTGHPPYGREWLTEAAVLRQAAALAAAPGLTAAGFVFVLIDSFWAADPTQVVDEWGRWAPNATRFPHGMAPVVAAIHAAGLKAGIYVNPGVPPAAVHAGTPVRGGAGNCTAADIAVRPLTGANRFWDGYAVNWTHPCAGAWAASAAALFAEEWGFDAVKIDAVSPGSDTTAYDNRVDVAAWSSYLAASGRPVWVSLSWAVDAAYVGDWAPAGNAARVADDVVCYCDTLVSWPSVARLFAAVRPWLPYGGAGAGGARVFPDLDTLDVAGGALDGLSDAERVTAATLWAVTGGPLVTGNDLTTLNASGVALLTHPGALAINAGGVPAAPTPASTDPAGPQVWAADYGNGTFAVALFNLADAPGAVVAPFADFAGARAAATFAVTDVWSGAALGNATGTFTAPALPPHGCQLILLTQVEPAQA
jgi:hypothetical protein